jgi:hypothetical protein
MTESSNPDNSIEQLSERQALSEYIIDLRLLIETSLVKINKYKSEHDILVVHNLQSASEILKEMSDRDWRYLDET